MTIKEFIESADLFIEKYSISIICGRCRMFYTNVSFPYAAPNKIHDWEIEKVIDNNTHTSFILVIKSTKDKRDLIKSISQRTI